MKTDRRANGLGSAIYLGAKRKNPWGARITLGWDIEGRVIRHFLGFFATKLDALLCLQDFHNNPQKIYIPEEKYNKIKFLANSAVSPIVPTVTVSYANGSYILTVSDNESGVRKITNGDGTVVYKDFSCSH